MYDAMVASVSRMDKKVIHMFISLTIKNLEFLPAAIIYVLGKKLEALI